MKRLIFINFVLKRSRIVSIQLLCLLANKTEISDLGDIPKNFIVKNYVPQTELLKYTKLFITHGGMNSTHEGIYNGVPLVVIPQSADQPVIAKQVENLGAGVKLQMQGLTGESTT